MKTVDFPAPFGPIRAVILFGFISKVQSLTAFTPPNDVQTNNLENGYSGAIIYLSVALMESYLGRINVIMYPFSSFPLSSNRFRAFITLRTFWNDMGLNPAFINKAREVFIIRDVIVHNHVWLANIDSTNMTLITQPDLVPGYGDGKFQGCP